MQLKKTMGIAAVALLIVILAACGNNSGKEAEQTPAQTPASPSATVAPATASAAPATAAPSAEKADPLGKYDPPIDISYVIKSTDGDQFDDQNTAQNNWWTRWAKDELGINEKVLWAVTKSQANQKWQLTVSSGELPDVLELNDQDFADFQKAGKLGDLTEAYNKYASDHLKEFMALDNGNDLKQGYVDGKLYGIPTSTDNLEQGHMVWVRTDWLKKLNLDPPKTMDDLVKIATAFAKDDPDGNGKADTLGLEINKDLLYGLGTSLGGIDGFFNGFHSYPTSWIKDSSGNLVNGSIQPETKNALAKLQEMYKNGVIDKEFGVKDTQKILQEATSGQVGLLIGPWWHPEYPITFNMQQDPNAEWQCYPLVSADDQPARPERDAGRVGKFYAINKDYPHPEALIKLINLNIEKVYESLDDYKKVQWLATAGPVRMAPENKDLQYFHDITKAIDSGDASKLNGYEQANYELVKDYMDNGTIKNWYAYKEYYDDPKVPAPFHIVQEQYIDGGLNMLSAYKGPPTEAEKKYGATLDKMLKETFTKIILGAPLSEFDNYVTNWKKLGGDQMTKEVNEWAAQNQ